MSSSNYSSKDSQNNSLCQEDEKNFGNPLFIDNSELDLRIKELNSGLETLNFYSDTLFHGNDPEPKTQILSNPIENNFIKNCIDSDLLRRMDEDSPIKCAKMNKEVDNNENEDSKLAKDSYSLFMNLKNDKNANANKGTGNIYDFSNKSQEENNSYVKSESENSLKEVDYADKMNESKFFNYSNYQSNRFDYIPTNYSVGFGENRSIENSGKFGNSGNFPNFNLNQFQSPDSFRNYYPSGFNTMRCNAELPNAPEYLRKQYYSAGKESYSANSNVFNNPILNPYSRPYTPNNKIFKLEDYSTNSTTASINRKLSPLNDEVAFFPKNFNNKFSQNQIQNITNNTGITNESPHSLKEENSLKNFQNEFESQTGEYFNPLSLNLNINKIKKNVNLQNLRLDDIDSYQEKFNSLGENKTIPSKKNSGEKRSFAQSSQGNNQLRNQKTAKTGWVCSICKNFNYEIRTKCNRCGKLQNKSTQIPYNKNVIQMGNFVNKKDEFINSDISICKDLINDKDVKSLFNSVNKKINHKNYDSPEQLSYFSTLNSKDDPTMTSKVSDLKKKKKPFVERIGDWVCIKCKNLNFSFRVVCNRCGLTKCDSEKLFDQYMKNLMNYVKYNEILQNQVMSNQNCMPSVDENRVGSTNWTGNGSVFNSGNENYYSEENFKNSNEKGGSNNSK